MLPDHMACSSHRLARAIPHFVTSPGKVIPSILYSHWVSLSVGNTLVGAVNHSADLTDSQPHPSVEALDVILDESTEYLNVNREDLIQVRPEPCY